ncbi:hypothetical protein [Isoptericola sp. BMS4]|uniref:hypothetical protein n=1 Tax=Isoptericola sp. BMS4 TaxID=2527875 RepID=UPI00196BB2B9|nr:hypothetical protein [Isoptericola sp. BMS4]
MTVAPEQDTRRSRALAALHAAEQRTGARQARRHAAPRVVEPGTRGEAGIPADPASPAEPVALAHPAGPAAGRAAGGDPAHVAPGAGSRHGPAWSVHPDLSALLPDGGVARGSTLAVRGSASLLLALLAAPSAAGAWTAFVGAPAVGMLAAHDAGMALARTALVPRPGPDAPAVVAALLDGMDLVVVGPQATLTGADRRRLGARARERGAVLVPLGTWPGAHVALDARGGTWAGIDHGAGWLRRRTLSVLRTGRGAAARPVEIDVVVPVLADGAQGALAWADRTTDTPDTADRPAPAGTPAPQGPRLRVA